MRAVASQVRRRMHRGAGLVLLTLVIGCDWAYPEVVVRNQAAPEILIKDASFSGCLWPEVLSYGQASSLGRCLPGEDRVHFRRLRVTEGDQPLLWFAYQTISVKQVGYSDFVVFDLTVDDMEQDFSIPGPYGH